MKCHRGAKRGALLFLRRLFFLFTDGELLQVVGRAVVDVQIHIARDAINLATVGELPKFPFTLVGQLFHVVVSNPKMVACESRRVEIFLLKLQSGIDDGGGVVVLLHDIEPLSHLTAELFGRERAYAFHVEHRCQIAWFEMHLLEIMFRLHIARHEGRKEVVGTTNEVVLPDLVEVVVEILVDMLLPFGSLSNDEANGLVVYLGSSHFVPVYFTLIATDVNASHGIFFGVLGGAKEPLPQIGRGSNDVFVGDEKIHSSGDDDTNPEHALVAVSEGAFSPSDGTLFPAS